MELTYPWVLYIGIPIVFLLAFLIFKRSQKYKDGRRVVGAGYLEETPYFKKIKRRYKLLKLMPLVGILLCLVLVTFMIARPIKVETINEEAHNRDIFLCMDISDSMDEVNLVICNQLKELVSELEGERFGISIFNGQSVLLVPLTSDYDYVMETLNTLSEVFEYSTSYTGLFYDFDYEMYYYKYEGTLCDRGSSFIGEGLASCLYSFTDLEEDPDRTRLIIFTTDNELNGEPLVTLKDAAGYCKKRGVRVYGLTPGNVYEQSIFQPAMEDTGGGYYEVGDPDAINDILSAIRRTGTNVTENIKTVITDHKEVLIFTTILLDVIFILMVLLPYIMLHGKSVVNHVIQGIALLLVIALNIRLMAAQEEVSEYTGNTDVMFVVDNTISMLAEDYNGNGRRIDAVKEDIAYIMEQFPGARYSVISFANDARRLIPYTTDITSVEQALKSLNGLTKSNANGTGLNAPLSVMKPALKSGYERGNRQLVFFISDGEITDDKQQNISNYGVLAEFIDGGAVLGYGTEQGGKMQVLSYASDEDPEYLQYYDGGYKDAVSVIDEANLQFIAKGLKVPYIHMTDQSKIYPEVIKLANDIDVDRGKNDEEEGTNIPGLLYFLTIPLFPALAWEYIYVKKRL